jgi:hypothetical protein
MENIISPIDRAVIKAELTKDKFLRNSNYANNEIYVISHFDSPNILQEIGRLREITFREAGGGTGKSIDLDKYDTDTNPYYQLIVWDPEGEEIIGGYRYICGNKVITDYKEELATTRLFNFSEDFIKNYLPYTIELGRSFVQPKYQISNNRKKGIYALDNLWDGLGALMVNNPNMKYFLGKITMYKHFSEPARDFILTFLNKYFPNTKNLVCAINPIFTPKKEQIAIFNGKTYKEDYTILSREVRSLGENIPPLFNAYMNLSSTMQNFGTVENNHFGGVEETGILISINDIYENKLDRHVNSI